MYTHTKYKYYTVGSCDILPHLHTPDKGKREKAYDEQNVKGGQNIEADAIALFLVYRRNNVLSMFWANKNSI